MSIFLLPILLFAAALPLAGILQVLKMPCASLLHRFQPFSIRPFMPISRLMFLGVPFLILGVLTTSLVYAHSVDEYQGGPVWLMWNADPWICFYLIVSSLLYVAGIRRLWGNAHRGAGISIWEAVSFLTGTLVLVVSLLSPIDALGNELFSVHMVQHELMMLIAAPFLVAGRPLAVWLWAFPSSGRKRIGRMVRQPGIRLSWQFLNRPLIAWAIHAAVIWAWHFPSLFQASLANDTVHAFQHFSFLASALLFWASLMGPASQWQRGGAVISVLTTAIHTGMLGALLTFSPKIWYPAYMETAPHWGYSALEDQQLGGLIMWVPAGFLFVFAGMVFAALALSPPEEVRRPATLRE